MSINRIHVNNSTKISLNDRFTIMQSVGVPGSSHAPQKSSPRGRSRSRGRSQSAGRGGGSGAITDGPIGNRLSNIDRVPKASLRNRQLVKQLETRHKMITALKLKKISLKTNMSAIQRQKSLRNRLNVIRARQTASVGGNLTRRNSLSNLATMKADFLNKPLSGGGRRLRRTNSSTNITARLGVVGQRRKLRRSNSVSNLNRQQINDNLRRRINAGNINLNQGGPKKVPVQLRRRLNRNNTARGSLKRSNSVNSRLGVNKTSPPIIRGRGGNRRANLRRNSAPGNSLNRVQSGGISKQARLGRTMLRGSARGRGQQIRGGGRGARNRSQSRSRSQVNQNINNGQTINRQRGRGRRRIGGSGRGGIAPGGNNKIVGQKVVPKSKEELDKELEQYMANTRSHLDREMDDYMKGVDF